MAVKKMYFLPCGTLTVNQSIMTYRRGYDKYVDIPVISVLIDTDDGYVLYDTGIDPAGLTDPENTWGEKAKAIKTMTAEHDIRNQLAVLGLKPSDIRYVVNSHFHYDHTGGNRFFTESTIIVQKAEYRFGLYPDHVVSEVYLQHQFNHPLKYKLIEGDTEVVEGVYITASYGHSPGHQSLIVEMPKSGTAVLVGDAMYCKDNFEKNIPPGNAWNMPMMVESINRLVHIAKRSEGKLYITHDPIFWDEHRPAPFFYE